MGFSIFLTVVYDFCKEVPMDSWLVELSQKLIGVNLQGLVSWNEVSTPHEGEL